jgi:hypothetical protein
MLNSQRRRKRGNDVFSKSFSSNAKGADADKGKLEPLDFVLGLLLIGGADLLYLFLPRGIVVVIWLLLAFWIVKRRAWSSITNSRHVASVCKVIGRFKVLSNMNDEEFESRFGLRDDLSRSCISPEQPVQVREKVETGQPKVEPFMPAYACKTVINDDEAMKLALAWWEVPGSDGLSGFQRIEELIQQINIDRSTARTAILTEYKDCLLFPKDEGVLIQLVEVAKANGLGAELSEDGEFIIQWGQDDNGREAGG